MDTDCVVFDRDTDKGVALASIGATPASSVADVCRRLTAPRHVWIMLPAGMITQSVVDELGRTLSPGDVIIDGGNSHYKTTSGVPRP